MSIGKFYRPLKIDRRRALEFRDDVPAAINPFHLRCCVESCKLHNSLSLLVAWIIMSGQLPSATLTTIFHTAWHCQGNLSQMPVFLP
jgi:hypothetical protein